ncbi:hypothetical protein LWX53_06245 [bacterium]|nr:hypothetical protein [bacterium]
MIAAMEKFILVVLGSDATATPVQLRKLGIAHVDSLAGSGEAYSTLERRLVDAQKAVSLLTSIPRAEVGASSATGLAGEAAIGRALAVDAEIASIQAEQGTIVSEMQRVKGWGDFDPSLVARLAEKDLRVRFFEGPAKKIKDIAPEVEFFRVASAKGNARIVVLGDADPSNAFLPFTPPRESYSSFAGRLKALELKQASLRDELAALARGLPSIKKALERIDADLTIERLRSGMPCEENLRYLTGYVPSKDAPKLAAEAKRRGWALAMGEPGDDDQPPTKIENPKAIAIVQPVLDFLGTVPNYREYEISGWFLVFFTIFFAMIFGDGGYGLVLLLAATAMAAKAKKAGKPAAPFNALLFVLGGATTLYGFVTATWFGLPFEALPPLLQNLSLTALNGSNPDSGTNTKILCFIIGALQLAIAHIKNVKRDFPQLKALAQVGSLCLVVGMFNAVLNLVVDASRFPISGAALGLIAGGFLLVFVFGNWTGKLGSSLAESLKGIIPTFLGTVSVFADIVSYIRLWAVGLAGIAISQTVNGMAVQIMGPAAGRIVAFVIGAVLGLVLLLAGHGLNIMMSVLSVVVHGMRLNMLEFSGHLGMEWSGYKYDPLSEMAEEDTTVLQE